MKILINNFLVDQTGATAVEYGLLVGGIGVVLFAALSLVGADMASIFTIVSDNLKSEKVD